MLIIFVSCKHQDVSKEQETYTATRPTHFPQAHYQYDDNKFTEEGFILGRLLFHDPILSIDSTVSCASCHKQKDAFADRWNALSKGVNNGFANRNVPPIFNMAWSTSFMWDGGVNHIEVSPLAALQSPLEMGENLNSIVRKLNRSQHYPELFKKAFHKDTINIQQLFWALAQYVSNIVSAKSRYDNYITGKGSLTEQELKGLTVFRSHCASCHKEPLFTDYSFRNNGIDSVFTVDSGRYRITQDDADWGKFKVPTLRNIELTNPYMHDGRFNTLNEVLDHYTSNVKSSKTLSPLLKQDNGLNGIPLNSQERDQLKAFLLTLTDEELLSDENLSNL